MDSKRARVLSLDAALTAGLAWRVHQGEYDVTHSIEAEADWALGDGVVEPGTFEFSSRNVSSESPSSTATQTETAAA